MCWAAGALAADFDSLLRDELHARASRLEDPAAHASILAAFRDAGPAGTEVALELLRSDVSDRAPQAARLLSELGGAEAVGGLLACATSHPSEAVREACEELVDEDVRTAGRIAHAESREQVLEDLASLKREPPVKVALLEQLALQTDPRRAEILAVALANLHAKAAPAALRRIATHLPEARAAKLREWADALEPQAVKGCDRLMTSAAPRCPVAMMPGSRRLRRPLSLEQRGDVRDIAELRRLLADSDRDVRLAAARALASMGDAEAVPVLIDAIPGPDPQVATGDVVSVFMTIPALIDFAGSDVAGDLAGASPQSVQAAWRAWWERSRDGFDAVALHVRFLSDRSGRPSFSILGRAGTPDTARAILQSDQGTDEEIAAALCRISARHAAVIELVHARALDSARGLRVLRLMDPDEARTAALSLVARGDAAGIDLAQEACARWQGGCDPEIVNAVVARLPELALQAEPAWHLKLPLARTHCPAIEHAAGSAKTANLRSQLSGLVSQLDCRRTGFLIVAQPDGSVALQRCGGTCQEATSFLGRPAIIADWSDDAQSPRTRHGMACASAEIIGVRTTVGLALALRSDDFQARRLAAQALADLAELSNELPPECVTPPDPRGAAIFDAPFLREQLATTAAGLDPDAAEPARRLLAARPRTTLP